jgi:hypothetical protein
MSKAKRSGKAPSKGGHKAKAKAKGRGKAAKAKAKTKRSPKTKRAKSAPAKTRGAREPAARGLELGYAPLRRGARFDVISAADRAALGKSVSLRKAFDLARSHGAGASRAYLRMQKDELSREIGVDVLFDVLCLDCPAGNQPIDAGLSLHDAFDASDQHNTSPPTVGHHAHPVEAG